MTRKKEIGDKIVKKVRTAEGIILKLRKIETLVNQGKTIVQASREEGISDYTYYRWRREYGGLNINQAKELKKSQQENEKLKKAVLFKFGKVLRINVGKTTNFISAKNL
jgi:transposase-like protein